MMEATMWLLLYLAIGLLVTTRRWNSALRRSMKKYPNLVTPDRMILMRIAGIFIALTWPLALLHPFIKRKG